MEQQRFKNSFAENLIWLAGFIDGDGCIYCKPRIHNNKYKYIELQIIVGQSGAMGLKLCEELQYFYGFGKITSYHGSTITKQKAYLTRLQGKKALMFLKKIVPYLYIKKQQAEEAIKQMDNRYGNK